MIAFGPVPSRRLGKSLGINNIPAKICSYSCIYCQIGKTLLMSVERKSFCNPVKLFKEIKGKVDEVRTKSEKIDYLTFVSDGEPTLDVNLGKEIDLLRQLDIPIAVLTNASLLFRENVTEDLLKADLVSLKIDAFSENLWKKVNRPHKSLKKDKMIDGILSFSKEFKGTTFTETMLIDGLDYKGEFEKIAELLVEVRPEKTYVAVPTRPPAESWVKPARELVINDAFQFFSKKLGLDRVEFLIGYEGDAFAFTGQIENELLGIMAVHPMRETAIMEFLKKANAERKVIEILIKEGKILPIEYEGNRYYVRRFKKVDLSSTKNVSIKT